jgi:hypothetical protein
MKTFNSEPKITSLGPASTFFELSKDVWLSHHTLPLALGATAALGKRYFTIRCATKNKPGGGEEVREDIHL